jgi:hypothetical protein
MQGLLGKGLLAQGGSVEANVDSKLNVVARWKLVECELRDEIQTLHLLY